jgi:hypothetical protein
MRTPSLVSAMVVVAALTLSGCSKPASGIGETGLDAATPIPSLEVPFPIEESKSFGEPAEISAAGGSQLQITPLRVVGRIRTSSDLGRVFRPSALFIAVKIKIVNSGSVPWDPKTSGLEGNPCFGVSPADATLSRCFSTIYAEHCSPSEIRGVSWVKSPAFKRSLLLPGDERIGWMTFCVDARKFGQGPLSSGYAVGTYTFWATRGMGLTKWVFDLMSS